jgi:hypothetical protein
MISVKKDTKVGLGISDPLSWRPMFDADANKKTAWLTCPNGHIAQLDHEISSDGTVTPSVDCPVDDCDFHEFVKLEGWNG